MTKKKANENDDKSTTLQSIIQDQLTSLDDSDCYASAWAQAQAQALSQGKTNVNFWGGRGKGGRGLARRTVQPHDIVLERVSLEYISDTSNATPHQTLLDGGPSTVLKLLGSHIYAIVGRNGCGKSTLLRRIFAKKIPGFASHLSTCYFLLFLLLFYLYFINCGSYHYPKQSHPFSTKTYDNSKKKIYHQLIRCILFLHILL